MISLELVWEAYHNDCINDLSDLKAITKLVGVNLEALVDFAWREKHADGVYDVIDYMDELLQLFVKVWSSLHAVT